MSGRLARSLDEIAATGAAWLTETELETLVEIAKAAREWDDDLSEYCDGPIRDRLRAAFARLDATTTEQQRKAEKEQGWT